MRYLYKLQEINFRGAFIPLHRQYKKRARDRRKKKVSIIRWKLESISSRSSKRRRCFHFFFFAGKRVDVWRSIQLQLGRDSIAISTRERGGNRDIPLSPELAQWPQARTSFALRYLGRGGEERSPRISPLSTVDFTLSSGSVGEPRWRTKFACNDKERSFQLLNDNYYTLKF